MTEDKQHQDEYKAQRLYQQAILKTKAKNNTDLSDAKYYITVQRRIDVLDRLIVDDV